MRRKKGKKKRQSNSEEWKAELLNLTPHLESKAWKLMFILDSRKMYCTKNFNRICWLDVQVSVV